MLALTLIFALARTKNFTTIFYQYTRVCRQLNGKIHAHSWRIADFLHGSLNCVIYETASNLKVFFATKQTFVGKLEQ
jgi:hypothetical protein